MITRGGERDIRQAQSWSLGHVEVPELGQPPTRHLGLGEGMKPACPVLQGHLAVDSEVQTFSRP